MSAVANDQVARALTTAVDRYGAGVLTSPVQARAIVSDLVGSTEVDHRPCLQALEAAVGVLRAGGTGRRALISEARQQCDSAEVPWAVDLVAARRGIELVADRSAPSRWLLFATAAFVVTATLLGLGAALVFRLDEQVARTTTTSTIDSTTTTTAPPELVATFAPVREADYTVARTWRASGRSLRVTVGLTPIGEDGIGIHEEATVGPGRVQGLQPVPVFAEEGGRIAYGPVDPGTDFEFSYRVDLDEDVSEATLRELLADWAPRRDAVVSVVEALDPLPEPTFTVE